jgi:hypothetical protein
MERACSDPISYSKVMPLGSLSSNQVSAASAFAKGLEVEVIDLQFALGRY